MTRSTTRRLMSPVPDSLLRHLMYRRRFGRWGRFDDPRRFTERLIHRMLHERTDRIAAACDKTRMKAHAREVRPELHVPTTLWSGQDLAELDLSVLPERWVLKPNHAAGMVLFGDRSTTVEELHRRTRGWLRPFERAALGEWGYRHAERCLLVEPDLRPDPSEALVDYKFFVFHGRVKVIQRNDGRFTDHRTKRFYTPRWEPFDLEAGVSPGAPAAPPESLDQLVAHAEALGAAFDFIRVDLYEIDGTPWFGELTPYPSGGMRPYTPDEVDFVMGRWWGRPQEET